MCGLRFSEHRSISQPKEQEAKQSCLEGDHCQEGEKNTDFVIQEPPRKLVVSEDFPPPRIALLFQILKRQAQGEVDDRKGMTEQRPPAQGSHCNRPVEEEKTAHYRQIRSPESLVRRHTRDSSMNWIILPTTECYLIHNQMPRNLPLGTSTAWPLRCPVPGSYSLTLTAYPDTTTG